jgi:hypothetical protein
VRQLRDVKVGTDTTAMMPSAFLAHARLCARALAFAPGRSGSASAIAGYRWQGSTFASAIAAWATAYADRTVKDHATLVAAAEDGRIPLPAGRQPGAGDE